MRHTLPTRAPFSFAQSLTFIRRFPPNHGEYVIGPDSITAAIALGDRAVAVTVRRHVSRSNAQNTRSRSAVRAGFETITSSCALGVGGSDSLEIEAPDDVPASEIVPRVSAWLGADHDLSAFYDAANGDPCFSPFVRELYGLHHVAFMSLAEIAVYCVMMQRAPIAMAARMKARFLDRFGLRVLMPGQRADDQGRRELRAMPELAALASLDGDEIADAIRHRVKGPAIATVVRGVAKLGEQFLRTAPYPEAKQALLDIPGVGPFSAGAILLRGLGRMDDVPIGVAEREARAIYGRAFDPSAIAKRYGAHIGYWSFYVKTGVARASQ